MDNKKIDEHFREFCQSGENNGSHEDIFTSGYETGYLVRDEEVAQLPTTIEQLQKERDQYLKTVGEMHDRIVELEAELRNQLNRNDQV